MIKIIAKYSIAFLWKYLYNIGRFKIYIQVQIKILSKLPSGWIGVGPFFYTQIQSFFSKSQFEVWEICKFWILQNTSSSVKLNDRFERYVNFEFYKTKNEFNFKVLEFERYVNFEFYKTSLTIGLNCSTFERYVNFEFYKTNRLYF